MADIDVTKKAEIYHILFQINSSFAGNCGDTSLHCSKQECSHPNLHENSKGSLKSCNQNSIKNSCSIGMRPKWETGIVLANCGKRKKNASGTRMTFSFTHKSESGS